jgi:hypothetical protein
MTDLQTQVMVLAAVVFGFGTIAIGCESIPRFITRVFEPYMDRLWRFFGMDDGSAG